MNELADRHAVVTGGGRGIGAAVAQALAEQGARVTLLGRDAQRLQSQAAALGERVRSDVADVTDASALERAFQAARAAFGPVDILVNNAGAVRTQPFHRTERTVWDEMLAINLTGTYLCTQQALPGMLQRNFGRIVNIASTAGLKGYPYVTAYCAAKHGVIGLTRALALETARTNITVNAVCPGYTDSDIVREAVGKIASKTGRSAEQALSAIVAANPQQRLVRPEEVANAVVWLCLPGADSVTGQAISVSGGEVM